MKVLIGLALAAAVGSSAPAADLKPFTFRTLRADLTMSEALRAGIVDRCRPDRARGFEVQTCNTTAQIAAEPIAGFASYGSFATFDDAGLAIFDVAVLQDGIAPVTAAFTARYGEPCDLKTSEIQNGFGAVFQQAEVVWCFSDGRLTLSRYAERNLQRAGIVFVSKRFAERRLPVPVVNF